MKLHIRQPLFFLAFVCLSLGLMLSACPAEGPAAPAPVPAPIPASPATPAPTAISLEARNLSFDRTSILVPAGAAVTIEFSNLDAGVGHNFAVYTDTTASQSFFVGEIIIGPATTTYLFTTPAEPGTYFFRCDTHPATMNGQFIVQ